MVGRIVWPDIYIMVLLVEPHGSVPIEYPIIGGCGLSTQCNILLISAGLGCWIFGKCKCWGLLQLFVDMAWEVTKMPYTVKKVCVRFVM